MSSPKGYSDQKKSRPAEFATVNPVGQELSALDVNAHAFVRLVGSDAVEANSTTSSIVATAHAAQRGDAIKFTSGALSGKQVVVSLSETNLITLGEILDSAPAAAVTFDILRHAKPVINSNGEVQVSGSLVTSPGPVQFIRDGVDTEVEESSGTPANSRPLPVKLIDASGAAVVPATAAAQTTANASLAAIKVATEATQASVAGTLAVSVGNFPATQVVSAATLPLPSGAATSAKQDTAQTSLSSILTSVQLIDDAIAGNEMQVDVLTLPALPAGTNNIGDVDVLTLPSIPAGTNNIGDVDVLTLPAIPAGSNLIGKISRPGRAKVELIRFAHSTPVTTAAYTQLVASTSAEINVLDIFDSSGETLVLAVGAAASEVNQIYIFPGGNGRIELLIPAGSRISVKAISANTASGELLINGLA